MKKDLVDIVVMLHGIGTTIETRGWEPTYGCHVCRDTGYVLTTAVKQGHPHPMSIAEACIECERGAAILRRQVSDKEEREKKRDERNARRLRNRKLRRDVDDVEETDGLPF